MASPHAILKISDFTIDLLASNASSYVEPPTSHNEIKIPSHGMPLVVVAIILAWLLWRLWTFTISPRLYPHRPRVYPYWLPCKL